MTKYFYSHLISISSVSQDLDALDISSAQKQELLDIAKTHMHQTIIEAILSELKEDDKKKFLELMAFGNDEKIWNHLNEKADKIEEKISEAGKNLESELRKDIKRLK